MANVTSKMIADLIRDKAAQVSRDTMLLARRNVTAATPVDTEHAASNWVLSVGRPYEGVCGTRESVSYAAQEAGDAAAMEYNGRDVAAGRALYLRDNVFYMKYLDRGWSQQAVAGFVLKAILARGSGATSPARHAPKGTRRAVRSMLRKVAMAAIKR